MKEKEREREIEKNRGKPPILNQRAHSGGKIFVSNILKEYEFLFSRLVTEKTDIQSERQNDVHKATHRETDGKTDRQVDRGSWRQAGGARQTDGQAHLRLA